MCKRKSDVGIVCIEQFLPVARFHTRWTSACTSCFHRWWDWWKLSCRIPWIHCIKFALWSCRTFKVTMYSLVALKTNSTIWDFSLLTRLSENGIATMCEWHTFWWIFQVFRKWKCQNGSKKVRTLSGLICVGFMFSYWSKCLAANLTFLRVLPRRIKSNAILHIVHVRL